MGYAAGSILAKTEVQGNPPIGLSYFGCSPSLSCFTTDYGMRIFQNGAWNLWTVSSGSSESNPPYLHTYNNYWSYKTCGTAC